MNATQRLFFGPNGQCLHGEKVFRRFSILGDMGALFLYLEMPELGAGTQGAGDYSKEVCQWILHNWNAEIPCIIGTPRLISVPSRFPNSGRVGAPTVPGRSEPIWLRFGYLLEDTERCSTLILGADRTMSS